MRHAAQPDPEEPAEDVFAPDVAGDGTDSILATPGQNYPPPGAIQASYGWLFAFGFLTGLLLFAKATDLDANWLFLVGVYAAYRILTLVYLSRAWKVLQRGNVRTTPGRAVGFLFIPIFHLYWVFVAYVGLATDWNRVINSYPSLAYAPRLSPALAMTTCLLGVLLVFVAWLSSGHSAPVHADLLIGAAMPALALAGLGSEVLFFRGICRGINFMGAIHSEDAEATGGRTFL